MAKDGELYDKRGVPLYRGDLVKKPHFKTRRKNYWMYHVCVWNDSQNALEMVPTSELEPCKRNQGGKYWPTQETMDKCMIISGYGPDHLPYEDRPRKKG